MDWLYAPAPWVCGGRDEPVVANKLLGAILGLVKGIIVTLILVNVVSGLVSAVGDVDDSFWSRSALESSVSYSTISEAGLIIDVVQ